MHDDDDGVHCGDDEGGNGVGDNGKGDDDHGDDEMMMVVMIRVLPVHKQKNLLPAGND